MAGLQENGQWEEEVYRLETDDYAEGGLTGVLNIPAKQLANRTRFLRNRLGTDYVENKTGATNSCVLAKTPVSGAAVMVFINRLLAIQGDDYNLAGETITFTPAISADDDLRVIYRGI
jgi:hypothetical protein